MSWLVLELNEAEGAALAQAAVQARQTPQEFIKAAIAEYLESHPHVQRSTAAGDGENTGNRPPLSGGVQGHFSLEQTCIEHAGGPGRRRGQ